MTGSWITCTKTSDGVAHILLNRPEKRNALHNDMLIAMQQQIRTWEQDSHVRLLQISGSGEHFCAGADIDAMRQAGRYNLEENIQDARILALLLKSIFYFPRPVISIVQGSAYGGALGLLSASDIVICADNSQFCLSEVRLGLVPAVISPYVAQAIGMRQMQRYALSAERINAAEAQALGLVHQVTPLDQLTVTTKDMIQSVCKGSPHAQAATKQLIRSVTNTSIDEQILSQTTDAIAQARMSASGQEGTKAFLEKRKANWML